MFLNIIYLFLLLPLHAVLSVDTFILAVSIWNHKNTFLEARCGIFMGITEKRRGGNSAPS